MPHMSNESIAIINAFATIFAGLGGACLGAFFAFRSGRKMLRIQEFNRAATDFREAFLPEILYLQHNVRVAEAGSTDNLCDFLTAGFSNRHLKAFGRFRSYLSSETLRKFDKAWEEYCYYKIEGDPDNAPFFAQYFEETWEGQPTRDLALRRINKILSFAEIKHEIPSDKKCVKLLELIRTACSSIKHFARHNCR